MAGKNREMYNSYTYTSTAPQMEPTREIPERKQRDYERELEADRERARVRRNNNRIRREQARALSYGRFSVFIMTVCACALFAACGLYVFLQSEVTRVRSWTFVPITTTPCRGSNPPQI